MHMHDQFIEVLIYSSITSFDIILNHIIFYRSSQFAPFQLDW